MRNIHCFSVVKKRNAHAVESLSARQYTQPSDRSAAGWYKLLSNNAIEVHLLMAESAGSEKGVYRTW